MLIERPAGCRWAIRDRGAGAAAPAVGAGPEQLIPAPATRPAQPSMAARYSTPLVADHCVDRDLAAPPVADVARAVLDRSYALAPDDVPPDLVDASAAGLDGASGARLVRDVVVADLGAMRAAWQAAGLTIVVESAYRSYEDQAATFDAWTASIGHEAALLRAARPGHSEHQLGTAIDVTSPGWSGRFGDWAVEAAEGAWMAAHAWEYGFVMSYPAGGQDDSCYGYEPWHYRWIGREAAAEHGAAAWSCAASWSGTSRHESGRRDRSRPAAGTAPQDALDPVRNLGLRDDRVHRRGHRRHARGGGDGRDRLGGRAADDHHDHRDGDGGEPPLDPHAARRPATGMLVGIAGGALGGLVAFASILAGSLPLLLLGSAMTGFANGAGQLGRYVAADTAVPERRAATIGTVVWGSTVGAVVGPNLVAPAGVVAEALGLPALAGAYLLTMVFISLSFVIAFVFLRPEPYLLADHPHCEPGRIPAHLPGSACSSGIRRCWSRS